MFRCLDWVATKSYGCFEQKTFPWSRSVPGSRSDHGNFLISQRNIAWKASLKALAACFFGQNRCSKGKRCRAPTVIFSLVTSGTSLTNAEKAVPIVPNVPIVQSLRSVQDV